MFYFRLLTHIKIIVSELTPLSCKYSSSGKPNILRFVNSENKCLYGDLLETQKQRRKKVKKAEINDKTETNRCVEIVAENKLNHEHLENCYQSQEPPKLKVHKSKSTKSHSKTIEESGNSIKDEKLPVFSNDEFNFKSAVVYSNNNYPINNPDKNNLFSPSSSVESVLNYSFSDPVVKRYLNFPSVSKIIEDTMTEKNKAVLDKWRQNMIKELGEDGFQKHNRALKTRGQEFHTAVLYTVLGKRVVDCSETTRNALNSLSWMLEQVSNPMAVESLIAHPKLGYKGIPDCVALFQNIPVVIDWKLSEKPKKDLKDTYDAPVQITAYIGAMNHDPNYEWEVNHGLVAVAYTNGDPCDVFLLAPKHCQIYWRHWLQRLEKFKSRSHLHLEHNIDEKALELL